MDDRVPLSVGQAGLLYLHETDPDLAQRYTISSPMLVEELLDPDLLHEAWRRLTRRHPVFASTIQAEDGGYVQCYGTAEPPFEYLVVDDVLSPDVLRQANEEVGKHIDLFTQAPLRLHAYADGRRTAVQIIQHHIVSDLVTALLLQEEIFEFYVALREGREPVLDDTGMGPFAAYVAAERKFLAGPRADRAREYWREQLAGCDFTLDLPGRRGGAAHRVTNTEVSAIPLRTSAEATAALNQLATETGTSPALVLFAAYSLTVRAATGREDVLIGFTTKGRKNQFARTPGYFVRPLLLRVPVGADSSFREVLSAAHASFVGAVRNQELPASMVLGEVGAREGMRGGARYEVNFQFEPYEMSLATYQSFDDGDGTMDRGDLVVRAYPVRHQVAQFPLGLQIGDQGEYFGGGLHFDPAQLDEGTARTLADRFLSVVEGIAADPTQLVRELAELTGPERTTLDAFAGGKELPGQAEDVLTAIQWVAATDPGRTALVAAGRLGATDAAEPVEWTYAQLNEAAAALAQRLPGEGLVALCLRRDVSIVVGMLAALHAGRPWVALDPKYPADRLAQMLEDSGATAVVTSTSTRELVTGLTGATVVDVHGLGPATAKPGTGEHAYVIFTSGSTGRPKGVVVGRHAFAEHLRALTHEWEIGAADRALVFGSFSFDVSLEQLFGVLSQGGTAVIRPDDLLDPAELLAFLEQHRVTVFNPPTGVWRQMAGALAEGRVSRPAWVPRLTSVGGDAMPAGDVRVWLAEIGGRLVNAYGPTETVITATTHDVTGAEAEGVLPIGRPLPGRRVYVLDAAGMRLPPGALGELYVGGTIAEGYLGRPELTAERFTVSGTGERLYRTGDLVRFRADGVLEFHGRADDQVKIRGFRIEPGEIEAVLRAQADVADAVVIARPTPQGELRLLGYVVATTGAALESEALRTAVSAQLPAHLVPAALVVLDALPLSRNGKVDKAALPEPDWQQAAGEYQAPETEAERVLAEIWAQVLGLDRVGRDDDYLTLGGDSILSIQIVARARQAGLRLNPRQLFDYPTVAALAERALADGGEVLVAGGSSDGPAPMHRWFAELAERGDWDARHWNMSVLLRLTEPTTPEQVTGALHAVLTAHPALRTHYRDRLTVGEARPVLDVSTVDDDSTWQAHLGLDPAAGHVLRAVFDPVAGELLLVAHHLAVDVVSWRILVEDLADALAAIRAGRQPALAPEATTVAQWVAVLEQRAKDPAVVAAVRAESAELPTGSTVDGGTEGAAHRVRRTLDEEATAALRTHVSALGATLEEALLAATGRAKADGRPGVLLELESHGRADLDPALDTTRTVGWFTSLTPFPVRTDGSALASLWQVRARLKQSTHRGLDHLLVRQLGAAADLPEVRPEANVNFLGTVRAEEAGGPVEVVRAQHGTVRAPGAPRAVPVLVEASVTDGRFELTVEHVTAEDAAKLADAVLAELTTLTSTDAPVVHGGVDPRLAPETAVRAWAQRLGALDAVWPLTPMQSNMLFQTLTTGGTGVYVDQLGVTFTGTLDPDALAQAWRQVVLRHAVLRGVCAWDGVPQPLLVVASAIELEVAVHDLRGAADGEAAVREFTAADHARGFDLAGGPLLRVSLLRTAEDRWTMLFSHHHVILDGWSVPLLLGEVLGIYSGLREGLPTHLPPAPDYGQFLRWSQRPRPDSTAFWREHLRGYTTAVPIVPEATPSGRNELTARELTARELTGLRELARTLGVTPGSVLHAVWGLVVAARTGAPEAVFGSVNSGRPPELAGVEEMVGNFINTVPLRLPLDRLADTGDWLTAVHERLLAVREHSAVSTAAISAASELPQGSALFDTVLTVANYPSVGGELPDLSIVDIAVHEQPEVPIVFGATLDEDRGRITLLRDPSRVRAEAATGLLAAAATALGGLATPGAKVGAVLDAVRAGFQADRSARRGRLAGRTPRPR